MGTKIHCKSYLPGYYSMRDLNEDSSSSSWPLCYGDKAITNGQCYNGFVPRNTVDGYPGYDKDALKQKMLEHEAVFKNQVYELHRLYRIQRDMMEEVRRKELQKLRESTEPSSSSSLRGSHVPSEDARKWRMAGFPLLNSGYGRTSISGVEIVNSPMSCTKGTDTGPGKFLFQNGSVSKDSEALDLRPLKVRKKLFDLHLPADEYIDTEDKEKLPDCRVSEISSFAPNGNIKGAMESSIKLYVGDRAGFETDSRMAATASASCLRNSTRLADLNEPVQTEEAVAPSSLDFLGQSSLSGEAKGLNQHAKTGTGFGVKEETIHIRNGFLINSVERKVDERGQLFHIYEAGSSKSNLNYITNGRQQDKLPIPSHPVEDMLNPFNHSLRIYPTGCSREDLRRDGNHHDLVSSDRNRDRPNNGHLEPLLASQAPGSYPFLGSSCLPSSWAQNVSSWAKPSLTSAAVMGRSFQTSAPSQEPFGGKWQVGASSRSNPGLEGELTMLNGFYQGSASGSKEPNIHLPSAGFDNLNCSRNDYVASHRSTNHGIGNFLKGSCHEDSKPVIDINLNEVVSKDEVILQDLTMIDGKRKPDEDHLSALPWLKRKPVPADDLPKSETIRDLNQPFNPKVMLASSDCEIVMKKEIIETQNVKKILGFPIFETCVRRNEPSPHVSTSASVGRGPEGNNAGKESKNRLIDINLECEPDEQINEEELTAENEKQMKGSSTREYIDLNSCISDYEDPSAPSYESKTASVKIALEIDLEAPVILDEDDNPTVKENTAGESSLQSLENKKEPPQDEVLRCAAETIFAISSSCPQIHIGDEISPTSEASLAESLLWFVNALSSCANELESTSGNRSTAREDSPEEMDDFEAMTLQLQETKEEDYMPAPFVPDFQKVEDTGNNALPTRSRRGQSRRGRQRRDFQRDILPGLASLSRHEVTEDLQTFGGLMRATGHNWTSGLTRRNGTRNGGGRGRRRAVVETVSTVGPTPVCTPLIQQLNSIEAGLEDRSLTGWGRHQDGPDDKDALPGVPLPVQDLTLSSLRKIHALLIVNGESDDPLLKTKLVSLYGTFGHVKNARLLFDEIRKPDIDSCKVMIRWYFMNDLYDEIIGFYKFMRRRFLVLDNIVLSIVLKACSELRDFVEGRKLHGYTVQLGSPDSFISDLALLFTLTPSEEAFWHLRASILALHF
ncbi:Pentatricopeptide repeat-containing protein, mitochondrial [Sesamum alatum]|uniref:Pentatricopeptide repeat-containing protein, mitochondrial n=1 Tax=Sesamum alatum TaxID=300844 RepID=A0AAE1YH08_9LAMI|nr:Pentatricopeptide repeat-containing protein, mitochondrial [Sesamum alatum]